MRQALVQCTDVIIESGIEPFVLVRKLYTKKVVPEDVYKKLRDKECSDTSKEHFEKILDCLKNRIEHNTDIFTSFWSILRNLNQVELADDIVAKYKGKYKNIS